MPQVGVASTRRHAQQAALARIRQLSRAGLDVVGFLNEVTTIVSRLVPNGAGSIDSPYWFTLDPESHLVTSIYGQGCDVEPSKYMQWELFTDDFMKTAEVLGNPRGVQTLHEVTGGEPQRSWFYRDVLVPEGAGQWLLVALRSSTGENWGTARLNRAAGEPMFSEHEIDVMAAAAPMLAEGVRRGLVVGEATDPDRPDAPGLVVMTVDGEVESVSPRVEEWFERLPDDDGREDGVPTSVLAVAAGAVRDAERGDGGGVATARVPMADGRWAVVHGAVMGTRGESAVTVIIEPAHPDRVAPLLMSIYELTEREQEVTRQVLRGGSTAELARQLELSPYTVQQHLKNIFEKTDVNSRGELVAKVFFDCYDLRTRDNHDRIRADHPIRGGPRPPRDRTTTT